MQLERRFHRFAKTLKRDVFISLLLIGTRAVSSVDGAIGVEEERGEGQVIIELEERQVERIALNQAHTHELVEQVLQLCIVTNNLLVKTLAGNSGDAPKDDQERFSCCLGFGEAGREIVVNPKAGRLHRRAIVAHLGIARLSRACGQEHRKNCAQQNSDSSHAGIDARQEREIQSFNAFVRTSVRALPFGADRLTPLCRDLLSR